MINSDFCAAFPLPPDYYHLFTTESWSKYKEAKQHNQSIPDGIPNFDPPTPPTGNFTIFGIEDNVKQ
jgi:hypothetical protein